MAEYLGLVIKNKSDSICGSEFWRLEFSLYPLFYVSFYINPVVIHKLCPDKNSDCQVELTLIRSQSILVGSWSSVIQDTLKQAVMTKTGITFKLMELFKDK
jgi:hypothetical protein